MSAWVTLTQFRCQHKSVSHDIWGLVHGVVFATGIWVSLNYIINIISTNYIKMRTCTASKVNWINGKLYFIKISLHWLVTQSATFQSASLHETKLFRGGVGCVMWALSCHLIWLVNTTHGGQTVYLLVVVGWWVGISSWLICFSYSSLRNKYGDAWISWWWWWS